MVQTAKIKEKQPDTTESMYYRKTEELI